MPDSFEKRYEGFRWIKVARHRDDPDLSWEERFKILERHHVEETQFLIDEVRALAKMLDQQSQ